MHRTCYHCLTDLGTNDIFPQFPIGRALAFDGSRGRLWVICPACTRWNLTPIEERWETIEACEKEFHGVPTRMQSDNIGLAVVPHRIDLVRVGTALFPEFAAWRYGPEFLHRHTRAVAKKLALLPLRALEVWGERGTSIFKLVRRKDLWWESSDAVAQRTWLTLPRGGGRRWQISAAETWLLPAAAEGLRLSVSHHFGRAELIGGEAERVLMMLMSRVNRAGAGRDAVDAATREVDPSHSRRMLQRIENKGLGSLHEDERLSVEMALHAETEQRAVGGELEPLRVAWREAAEVAAIADSLLVPDSVEAALQRLKDQGVDGGSSA